MQSSKRNSLENAIQSFIEARVPALGLFFCHSTPHWYTNIRDGILPAFLHEHWTPLFDCRYKTAFSNGSFGRGNAVVDQPGSSPATRFFSSETGEGCCRFKAGQPRALANPMR
jgi:hypothetical protein